MIDVFPAPVGPVMANRSSFEKSIRTRSRKLVNPSMTRLIGRIDFFLVQLRKQCGDVCRRFGLILAAMERGKKCVRVRASNTDAFRVFDTWYLNIDMQRIRQDL